MRYLIDPHGYFEEHTSISFFKGLVAVFFTGGFSFLITIASVIWMLPETSEPFFELIQNVGTFSLSYMFFGAFIWWALVSFIIYASVKLYGVGLSYYDALSVVGVGFVPLMTGIIIEFIITIYYLFTHPPVDTPLTAHVVLEGHFGIEPAIAVFLIRTVTLLWAGNIWLAGSHQMGRLTPSKSMITTGIVVVVLWLELIGASVL